MLLDLGFLAKSLSPRALPLNCSTKPLFNVSKCYTTVRGFQYHTQSTNAPNLARPYYCLGALQPNSRSLTLT